MTKKLRTMRLTNGPAIFFQLALVVGYTVGVPPALLQGAEDQSPPARKIVARLNGAPIYEDQLQSEVDAALRKFGRYGMKNKTPDLVKRLQKKALDKFISQEVIARESAKLKIERMDEQVDQRLKALQRKYGTGKYFENYLKRRKLTMEELKESLKTKVRMDEYLAKQGILAPEIPEERIKKFFEQNQGSFTRKETVDVSHILIEVKKDCSAEEKGKAREDAEKIRAAVVGGKDFAVMAKKRSDCKSARGGGRLGFIKKGYMPAEFDKAAFALKTDEVSKVVETKHGFHIIKVTDKKPAGVTPYADVKDFIKKYLQEAESKKKLAAHIEELKKRAKIEILLDESSGSAKKKS